MRKLEDIRQIINELDNVIIEKLSERFEAVDEVVQIKKEKQLSIFDFNREKEIIKNIQNKDIYCSEEIAEIYQEIMRVSRKYQAKQLLPGNIFLIGFMGAGKSTIGKMLSSITSFEFIDTDQMIEEKAQMKIPEIFEKEGETYFRGLETEALMEIKEDGNQIISCGGGIVIKEENRKILKKKGKTIFLNGTAEVLLDRLGNDQQRPLFSAMQKQNEIEKKERFKVLLDSRMPYYTEAADSIINVDEKIPEEIAQEILRVLINLKG
ncbi:MAG: hypothetical protein GX285_04395 [Clostridiales bacterium]|nr:hypothetical protein [Clostridiales bacterium]